MIDITEAIQVWNELADVLMDETGENIDQDFYHFEKGTDKYTIWNWLESICDRFSVYEMLYAEQSDFTDPIKQQNV